MRVRCWKLKRFRDWVLCGDRKKMSRGAMEQHQKAVQRIVMEVCRASAPALGNLRRRILMWET